MKKHGWFSALVLLALPCAAEKAPQTYCNPLSLPDLPISNECRKLRHGAVISPDKTAAWAYGCWQYEEDGVKKARRSEGPCFCTDGVHRLRSLTS